MRCIRQLCYASGLKCPRCRFVHLLYNFAVSRCAAQQKRVSLVAAKHLTVNYQSFTPPSSFEVPVSSWHFVKMQADLVSTSWPSGMLRGVSADSAYSSALLAPF